MNEIDKDRLRLLSEQSIFLKEDNPPPPQNNQQQQQKAPTSISDGHQNDNSIEGKAKNVANAVVDNTKAAGLKAVQIMKDMILKLQNNEKEEQALINEEEINTFDKIVSFACKYVVCAVFLGPVIAIVPAMVWNRGSKEKDVIKRKKLYSRMVSDIAMLDSKINDLENNPNANPAEKAQKYRLIQLRETLKQNTAKLRATLRYGEGGNTTNG